MSTKTVDLFPTIAAVLLIVLAACTIHLRGDEDQAESVLPMDQVQDPQTAKLAQCRFVTFEQKDALAECRRVWAEERRQSLERQAPSASVGSKASRHGSSLFAPPKDENRLSSGSRSIPQSKE